MDGSVITFLLAILIVGVLVFVAILLTGKRGHHFNTDFYQSRFLEIENSLRQDNPATYVLAIINGDKLLDKAMIEMGIPGGGRFSNLNAVWRAHKLRNAIAHETDLEVSYKQASNALVIYKQALKDLGAI